MLYKFSTDKEAIEFIIASRQVLTKARGMARKIEKRVWKVIKESDDLLPLQQPAQMMDQRDGTINTAQTVEDVPPAQSLTE